MNIEILETKLQTIFEDDSLKITEKNYKKIINDKLVEIVQKNALCNDAVTDLEVFGDNYISVFEQESIEELVENDINALCNLYKVLCTEENKIIIDIVEEILINQELYDDIKDEIPGIAEIVDELNMPDKAFCLDDILEWMSSDLSDIGIEDVENKTFYEYLGESLTYFNSFCTSKINTTNYVTNRKEVEENEGSGSN